MVTLKGFKLATFESQRTPPTTRNWNHLIKKFPV